MSEETAYTGKTQRLETDALGTYQRFSVPVSSGPSYFLVQLTDEHAELLRRNTEAIERLCALMERMAPPEDA